MDKQKNKEKISKMMGGAMVATALIIDGFQALLNFFIIGAFVNPVIAFVSTSLFTIWFWMLGVSFVNKPKNIAAMGIQTIIGVLPIINTLPELSLAVLSIVIMTRAENSNGALGSIKKIF